MREKSRRELAYLGQYLKPHKAFLAFSFVLSAVSTALGMIQPLFAKVLIDRVLLGGQFNLLLALLAAVVALMIVSFLIRVANSYLYTRYSARVLFRMREDLFDHLQRVPLQFYSKKKIGDIYSRIASDMADIQGLVTETVPGYLFNFLTCLVTASLLVWLNWQMALMSLVFLPVAVYGVSRIRPRLFSLSKEMAERNADISHFLFEALSGIRVIRAFGAERVERGKLEDQQSLMLRLLMRYQVLGIFSMSVPTLYSVLNAIVVFGYGGWSVMQGTLTIGSLVAFTIYQGRVFGPLQGLMDGYLAMQKSRVSIQRVREILDIEPEVREAGVVVPDSAGCRGAITFEGVSFAYEPEEPVLRGISFSIPAGKTTAIVGPSGVGKTTIAHLILRLFDPDAGRITLDGIDLKQLRVEWLRRNIALVSQDPFLFHTSILENIRFSRPQAERPQIVEAARAACIHEFIDSLPQGYETVVGDRGVRLSGGQKQRICIARSLLAEPRLLILDEATAFLDASVEERLKETIRGLSKGRTVIIVSHRASAVQGADKIVALGRSGLVYDGSLEGFGSFDDLDEAPVRAEATGG